MDHTEEQAQGNGDPRRARILLVDDERDLLALLSYLVDHAGMIPLPAAEPSEALTLFEEGQPSVAVVDLNLWPGDGFELIAELRRRGPTLPIIVLTARGSEDDKVRALDTGADDYVVKPFGNRELIARIRVHVRRSQLEPANAGPVEASLVVGALSLDLSERILTIDGESQVRLTGTEFRLLEYLMRNSNAVVATKILARHVWGYGDAAARDVVRVTLHRLRRKLGEDGDQPRFIETVPGIGLRLRPVPSAQGSGRPL